jgi:hypothetical protein
LHIHTTQATAAGNAMAGAQAAETAIALRRARELREKADKIKALSSGGDSELSPNFAADPQVISMLGGWAASTAAQGIVPINSDLPRASSHVSADTIDDLMADSVADPALDQVSVRLESASQIRTALDSVSARELTAPSTTLPMSGEVQPGPESAPALNPAIGPVSFWA